MGEMPSAEKQREQALRPLDEEVEKRQTVEKLSAFGSLYKNEKPVGNIVDGSLSFYTPCHYFA